MFNSLLSALGPTTRPRYASVARSFVEPIQQRNMLDAVMSNLGAGRVEQSNAFGMANDPGYGNAGNGNAMSNMGGGNVAAGGQEARGGNARGAGGGGGGNGAMSSAGSQGGRTQGPAGMPLGDAIMAQFETSYGGRRPNPAGDDIIAAVRRAAGETFGPEATVIGFSGTGEHGSQRHRLSAAARIDPSRQAGYALDLKVRLPDGSFLETTDPRARDFIIAAARNGVSGLGAGAGGEYMGAHGFHMDMFPLDAYSPSMGRAWASIGDRYEQDFINAYRPWGG